MTMPLQARSLPRGLGWLRSLLSVEVGEGARVGQLTALYAVLILGVVFVQTIAFALFIAEFGPQSLPYSYLTSATLASLAAFGYLKLSERASFPALLTISVGFVVVGCVAFWLTLGSPLARWAIFLLPAWFQTHITLVNLVVWPLTGRSFDVRQGKRLFGLVGAGNWLANILGGFIVAPLVVWLGTGPMLLLAAILTAAGLFILRAILNEMSAQLPLAASPSPRPAAPSPPTTVPAHGGAQPLSAYVRLIFVYIFLWWVAFFFLDNVFYDRAAAQFPDAAQLAQAIGLLLSATGVVALITTTFVTSRVLRRYGLRAAFLAMPVLVGAGMAALVIAGSLGQTGALLFWLAAFGKLVNVAWGFSLSQSALVLTYQPLPAEQRGRTQTLAEGIVQPLAIGFAGLALVGVNTLLGLRAVGLSWIFLGLIAALIAVIVLLNRQYPKALSRALARRHWGGAAQAPLDQVGLDLLRQTLHSPHPGAVIYALDMLEQTDPAAISHIMPDLLKHAAPEVRRAVLERIERLALAPVAAAVREAVSAEIVPEVKAAGLQALAAVDGPRAFPPLNAALSEPDPQIRRGALVGLLRYGGSEGALAANEVIDQLVASPVKAERILSAQVLAEVGTARHLESALALLNDPEASVRRAALNAASKTHDPRLWPAIVQAGAAPGTTRIAAWALAAGGEAALPIIEAAFVRSDTLSEQLSMLAHACGRIRGEAVIGVLTQRLGHADNRVRGHILEALSAAGYRAADPAPIRAQIRAEVAQTAWTAATLVDLGTGEVVAPLVAALESALAEARNRLCLWLSFLYDAPAILRAREALAHGPAAQRAYALEVLDTQLPADLKGLVLPVAEDLPPAERQAKLAAIFPQARQTRAARLQALIAGPEAAWFPAWTRACALFAAGSLPAPECADAVRAAADEAELWVREAAGWALARLDPTAPKGEPTVLSTIEKVIILKTVSVFSRTPNDVLADVAALLEEVDAASDETIFNKGDLGDSLYVIVAGRVRVHDGERLLNYLGERDVFGEMALLDPEPRVASVTPVEPTHLLRLAQAPFYDLMADRPEVGTGLIRVLTGHLRARVRDVAELDTRVKELEAAVRL